MKKSIGINSSEKYLANLCERSFLSLWSFPNLYREKGKELADLIVIFGDHILIFSDKTCKYPNTGNLELDWNRWFRKTIKESAEQLWGAERWIRKYPERIFLDKECKQRFPFNIDTSKAKIHLILVARGVSESCKEYFGGGSGSLMINNSIQGFDSHNELFSVGDVDPSKTFIHVLDDITLDIVMGTLDTISDLVSYFSKKECLLRSSRHVIVSGEEDLLPQYLTKIKNDEHDFDFPEDLDGIAITEGAWDRFCANPQRKAQIEENRISYIWDELIERFNINALNGTQYMVSSGGIRDSEKVMRFFARETRFKRRILAKSILGLIEKTPENICGKRFILPLIENDPFYVFVVFPIKKGFTNKEYRSFRGEYLKACCMIVRSVYPNAKDIVGLATESGPTLRARSEDALYLDGRYWDEEMEKEARDLQQKLGILIKEPEYFKIKDDEFPDIATEIPKVGVNKKCPCGSGKKYKKCHGK